MTQKIVMPFQYFADLTGAPLEAGKIYIGTAGVDPKTNPIAAYWDEAKTAPADQPIRTLNGYPQNVSGANIFVDGAYSIAVFDKNDVPVYSNWNVSDSNAQTTANTADIAINTSDIATNAANIATNTSGITQNAADIAANAMKVVGWAKYSRGSNSVTSSAGSNPPTITRTGDYAYTIGFNSIAGAAYHLDITPLNGFDGGSAYKFGTDLAGATGLTILFENNVAVLSDTFTLSIMLSVPNT